MNGVGVALTQVGMETMSWYRYEGTVDVEGVGIEMEKLATKMGAAASFPYGSGLCQVRLGCRAKCPPNPRTWVWYCRLHGSCPLAHIAHIAEYVLASFQPARCFPIRAYILLITASIVLSTLLGCCVR